MEQFQLLTFGIPRFPLSVIPLLENNIPKRDLVPSSTRQNLAMAVKSAGSVQSLHSHKISAKF
jgi:hypothetical protein